MSADTEIEAVPTPGRSQYGRGRSFVLRYLGGELGRRARQATVIALRLAVGIGLVVTVSAAASGVQNAQAGVLHTRYGAGTDITVTQPPGTGSGLPGGNKAGIHAVYLCKSVLAGPACSRSGMPPSPSVAARCPRSVRG